MAGAADRPEGREPAAREPLVGSDPLGLGGTTAPDAPSRHPRPRILALLGEFFRMSRTTAVLLAAFLLVGALYLLVREDPVVGFGPPPAAPEPTAPPVTDAPTTATEEPTAPATSPAATSPTGTGAPQPTRAPTGTASPDGTGGGAEATQAPRDAPVEEPQASAGGGDEAVQPPTTG